MPRNTRSLLSFFLITTSAAGLLFQGYLGSYTRFIADDFCSAHLAGRLHMFRFVWYWYLNWGGRYSAIAFDSLIEYIGTVGVRFVPAVILLGWALVTFLALKQMLKNTGLPTSLVAALALLTVNTITTVTPGYYQILFWWNGMRTYTPALIAFTFHIGFLYWSIEKLTSRTKLVVGLLLSFSLAFFSGGFNETFTVVQLLFFAGLPVLGLLTKKLRPRDPAFLLLVVAALASALSLLIMLTAPGTANRQGYFHVAPGILAMFAIALQGFGDYLLSMLGSVEKVTSLLELILAAIWIGTLSKPRQWNGWMILLVLGVGLSLSFASLLPSAYSLSEMPAPRTYVVTTFALVAALLLSALLTGNWLSASSSTTHQPAISMGLLAVLVLSVTLSTWTHVSALYASRDTYSSFAERWDAAEVQILQAKARGDETVNIPVMSVWTGPGGDPTDNPRFWVNQCYAQYYDITVLGPDPSLAQP